MARKQQDTPEPEKSLEPQTAVTEPAAAVDDPVAGDARQADAEAGAVEAGHDDTEPHEPEHHEPDHHDDGLEEHGNFPTWLKVAIILLFGAGIALWGGPRIAPMLPSGLEPVARFLTPGEVRQAQEIDARLRVLEQKQPAPSLSSDAIDAAVQAAMTRYDATIRSDLEAMRDTVSAVDGTDIEARLTQVETAVKGLEAQMTSLGERLSTAVAEGIDQQTAQSAEQAAAYQATLDRLKAEIDTLSAGQGTLQQKIDEVTAANTRIKQEAQNVVGASQAEKAATDIAAALETGAAFRPALDVLAGAVDTGLDTLQALADRGAPSLAQLKSGFTPLAYDALRASIRADADTYSGEVLAFFKSQIATRSLTPQPGNSTDAILSRMDAALAAGNLAECLTEAGALNDAARAPLADWLASVTQLSEAMTELATATAQIARQKN